VILGALIQWPTLLTLLMAPVLLASYTRLARREERELEARFGEAYRIYQE
jgi:protein-S-isoprenylcysteine O-methyltransferase Ste14